MPAPPPPRPRLGAVSVLMAVMLAGCGVLAGQQAAEPGSAGYQPPARSPRDVAGGDPGRGKLAISRYGCSACHTIPGVPGATGQVGPPLTQFSRRSIIAGQIANTPDGLVRWIRDPQAIEPGTAMPALGVTEGEARDIAAYLYTLR